MDLRSAPTLADGLAAHRRDHDPYDPTKRVGDDACPYTTLYWDLLGRHQDRFAENARMAQAVRGLDRLSDLPEVRARAAEVRRRLSDGTV